MSHKLRIGKIPYTNLFPIFHVLQNKCDCRDYEFTEGYPSLLNRMLREGSLDISPSSSIEYLRDERACTFIKGHSISSRGPVESILLFSRMPLESLDGHEVFATHQSETSVALLKVILKKFHKINCSLKITDVPAAQAIESCPAYLAIGDEALSTARALSTRCGRKDLYIYDLGTLWYEHTGLPFVFALWIFKKDLNEEKKALLERLKADLDRSKLLAMESLPDIARASAPIMPPDELVSYWRKISYDFGEEHSKGLQLFGQYLRELKIVGSYSL